MDKWHLIESQPLLGEIYKEHPLVSFKKGKSLEPNCKRTRTVKVQKLSEQSSEQSHHAPRYVPGLSIPLTLHTCKTVEAQ